MKNSLLVTICILILHSPVVWSDAVDTLQPGQWYAVPNDQPKSTIDKVAIQPADSLLKNIIDAWNGAAFDTKRNELLVWGGGHSDYWGNEMYAFSMDSLTWRRLNDPYLPAKKAPFGTTISWYGKSDPASNSPASRHTYDGIQYLPNLDKFWSVGGSLWRSGSGTTQTVEAKMSDDPITWQVKADAPLTGTTGISSAYDPVTKNIYVHSEGKLLSYDSVTGKWKTLRRDTAINGLVGEYDPVNRKFVILGKGKAYVYSFDANGGASRSNLNSVGDNTLEGVVPGLAWDPTINKVVGWAGGSTVFTLDLSKNPAVWNRLEPSSGNTVTPTKGTKWGTYGRWRYVPARGVFVGVNGTKQSVYIYKLGAGGGTGGGPITPRPEVNLNVNPVDIENGASVTVTWVTTNTTSCTASGSSLWTGSKPLSNQTGELVGPLTADVTLRLNCSGEGGITERSVPVSVVTLDTTPPELSAVNAGADGLSVELVFSEAVNSINAEDIGNYTIDNGILISAATLAANLKTVTLTTSQLSESVNYTLSVSNIMDLASTPNAIAAASSLVFSYVPGVATGALTPSAYEWDTLTVGETVYIDRSYTVAAIPEGLVGIDMLRTANDDKVESAPSFITLTVADPALLIVGYDQRNTVLPSWLASQEWQDSGAAVAVDSGEFISMRLYSKNVSAGTVSIGGNETGINSMYMVMLAAADTVINGSGGGAGADPGPVVPDPGPVVPGPGPGPGGGTGTEDSGAEAAGSFHFAEVLFLALIVFASILRKMRYTSKIANQNTFGILVFLALGGGVSLFTPSVVNAAAQIQIPLDTWVAVPVPTSGKGPSGEMKHMRLAYNQDDGRIYFLGGDFLGPGFGDSGRNEVYSYSIETNDWDLVQKYCRPDSGLQPKGPDQVGWAYDSKRKRFWLTPGYMTVRTPKCTGSSSAVMNFDPSTGRWEADNFPNTSGSRSDKKFLQYDPVTDTLIRFAWTGSGPRTEIYNIAQNIWSTSGFSASHPAANARIGFDYTAIDVESRVIYMISPYELKLFVYNIDAGSIEFVTNLPKELPKIFIEGTYLHWDTANKVLLWVVGGTKSVIDFFVYHPADNVWESRPINQPEGLVVRGNNSIYDPVQNVLMLIGGYSPANPNIFLYRYANGDGTLPPPPAPDTTAPKISGGKAGSDGMSMQISFNERIKIANAIFTVDNNISVNSSQLESDTRTVTLLTTALIDGVTYVVTVNGVTDTADNAIIANSTASFTYTAPKPPPTIGGSGLPNTEYTWDVLALDKDLYYDRSYKFSDIPEGFLGLSYLKTANDDKSTTDPAFIGFELDKADAVYVALDNRILVKPSWLANWEDTNVIIKSTALTMNLYKKDYPMGPVTLGGNEADSSKSMYVVVVGQPQPTGGSGGNSGGGGTIIPGGEGSGSDGGGSTGGGGGSPTTPDGTGSSDTSTEAENAAGSLSLVEIFFVIFFGVVILMRRKLEAA